MKNKILLGLALAVLAGAAGIFSPRVFAATPGVCSNAEKSQFPYGFICSRDNTDDSNVTLGRVGEGDESKQTASNDNPKVIPVDAGAYISMQAGFKANDAAKNGAGQPTNALVWIYVMTDGNPSKAFKQQQSGASYSDANGWYKNGITDINSVNGKQGYADQCPGFDSVHGKVFNASDSPASYTGSGANDANQQGFENCGDKGAMAVWKVPVNSAQDLRNDFKFSIALNPGYEGKYCVRQEISVDYGFKDWPDPTSGSNPAQNSASYPERGKTNASYVAKQSKIICYQTKNHNPTGRTLQFCVNGNPNLFNVTAYDPDDKYGNNWGVIRFKIGTGKGSNFKTVYDKDGNIPAITNKDGTLNANPHNKGSPFTLGATYTMRVYDTYTDKPYDETNPSNYFDIYATVPKSCANNPGGGNGSHGAVCTGYLRSKLTDNSLMKITSFPKAESYYAGPTAPTQVSDTAAGKAQRNWIKLGKSPSGYTSDYNIIFNTEDATFDTTNPDGFRAIYNNGTDNNFGLVFGIPRGPDRVVMVEKWELDTANKVWNYSARDVTTVENCYSASCSLQIEATVPNTDYGVYANQKYRVSGSITNTGSEPLEEDAGGTHLGITGQYDGTTGLVQLDRYGDRLPSGLPGAIDFELTAPDDINNHTLNLYPDYYGRFALGAACDIGFTTYRHFDVTPSATITTGDSEHPPSIKYTTGGTNSGVKINRTYTSRLEKTVAATGSQSDIGSESSSHDFDNWTKDYEVDPGPYSLGDSYCAYMTIDNATGDLGPNGPYNDIGTTKTVKSGCLNIQNKPYVHFLGSDVSAGGGFGEACTSSPGTIKTFMNNNTDGTVSGSGVQIGALSIDKNSPIEGFSSALLRTSDPKPASGLSFSNTIANISPPGSASDAKQGGKMGGSHCAPDYFSKKPADTVKDTSATSISLSGKNGAYYYKPANSGTGTLNISGGTIAAHAKVAIYVEGNVNITGNILYQGADQDWCPNAADALCGTIENIPNLRIVVYGGALKIDNAVSQMDGLFISQPKGTTGGSIYTCPATAPITDYDVIRDNCSNQLVVNGAFTAKSVYLLRTFGSLRDANSGERLSAAGKTCNVSAGGTLGKRGTLNGDCAAEIFNFSPEMYLSESSVTPSQGPTTGKYDFITSLSPVL